VVRKPKSKQKYTRNLQNIIKPLGGCSNEPKGFTYLQRLSFSEIEPNFHYFSLETSKKGFTPDRFALNKV